MKVVACLVLALVSASWALECPVGTNVDEIVSLIDATPVPTCQNDRLTYVFNASHDDDIIVEQDLELGVARLTFIFQNDTTSAVSVDNDIVGTLSEPSVLIEAMGCGATNISGFGIDTATVRATLDYSDGLNSLPFTIVTYPSCSGGRISFLSGGLSQIHFQEGEECDEPELIVETTSTLLDCTGGFESDSDEDSGMGLSSSVFWAATHMDFPCDLSLPLVPLY